MNIDLDLIPARILNEFVYCPRLAYLEFVQSEFADNVFTVSGRYEHRRVDRPGQGQKLDSDLEGSQSDLIHSRSVKLTSEKSRIIGVIDCIDGDENELMPVDYKHGSAPKSGMQIRDTDRIQLAAQVLLLRDNGFTSNQGVIYYIGSKTKIPVEITKDDLAWVLDVAAAVRRFAEGTIPAPLHDSPKCPHCSLVGICLPDETTFLNDEVERNGSAEIRRLIPSRHDSLPLYVQTQGARIGKSGDRLTVEVCDQPREEVKFIDVSQVSIFGGVSLSTPAIHELCQRKIPALFFSHSGWFYGQLTGLTHKNIEIRKKQYEVAADQARSLALARRFVHAKIRNARTMLRRNGGDFIGDALKGLKAEANRVKTVRSVDRLLGCEGNAARIYFQSFSRMLKVDRTSGAMRFEFEGRNRRPPKDPVNAMLSLGYALLTKDFVVAIQAVGLDPYLGFYHADKYGRPALALDLMEEFRPIIVDSVVIGVINGGLIVPGDCVRGGGAVTLSDRGRKRFIQAYERRMDQLVTHPVFGYRISYRQVLEVQVRLLSRYLCGEIPDYPEFVTR